MTDDPYVRCPDCEADGERILIDDDGILSVETCGLCDGVGHLKESQIRERLPPDEADEIMDLYHRRNKFEGIPQPISPFVKGGDA